MKLLNKADPNKRPVPFTDDWDVVGTLGEGSFGEVKLLVHRQQHDSVAVKIMCFDGRENRMDAAKREACVLRNLKHRNVISSIGHRIERNTLYLFLEYASEGELYDRIGNPDVGMPIGQAQYFFQQLIAGVDYIHSKGITHRDLKPENVLIAEGEVLKISDFGMATVFRNKRGIERMLETRCGTLPYVAPEVLLGPYHAQPVDIWSCGVVLVAMLVGQLPWDSPTEECKAFARWSKMADCSSSPWHKIHEVPLSLLKMILTCDPLSRITMDYIKKHAWLTQNISDDHCSRTGTNSKLTCNFESWSCSKKSKDHGQAVYMSQPPQYSREKRFSPDCDPDNESTKRPRTDTTGISFSQPTNLDNLLLSSQAICSQTSTTSLEKLVKRMTRLSFHIGLTDSLAKVEEACILMGMQPTCSSNQITVSTVDSRRNTLIFKVAAYQMNSSILLDFRLSKGDGLDFKRMFLKLKALLSPHIKQAQDPKQPSNSRAEPASAV
ncbi:serine:threonine protein kinase Chk1 [Trichuris trichiura]|uniref:non-specific serine/threonine protein kinase n=1 Tax=Trichuris trichiura TaxID=36087 RepID=A0A077Z532_TRITR|nr:serine:threonine protein kinase Chk1 [Trichuris trichiura]